MLVKDVGRKHSKGTDLSKHEVKSAENEGNYEYQYHKDSGIQKLEDDMKIGHLFFDHSNNLRQVDLRYMHGSELRAKFFEPWKRGFPVPYQQRYRKSVPFGFVKERGTLLMSLRDGEVIYPKLA